MPARKSWSLPDLKYSYRPAFAYRGFHLCGAWRDVDIFREWMARNFINVHRHAASAEEKRRGFYSMWSSHNVALPAALFDQHPEYFAEIGGKRYKNNICFSHPEVDKLVAAEISDYLRKRPFLDILSLFPRDNQDYCRCERCAETDVSTTWFHFYNRLTDTLKKEFPDLKFATIAYQGYRNVPQCPIRNSEFVEYASYSRCNIHPYGEPDCRHNEDTLRAMLAWQATGLPIGHYAYEYDVYSKNARFTPFFSVIENAVQTSRRLGHVAVIPEVSLSPRDGPNKPPADYWRRHLAPAVRDGALAVFVSYWGIPLDEYFQDPSLKVKVVSCGKIPLAERTTTFIAPGDWSRKPNDLLGRLKSQITPAYGFVPEQTEGWTVLATASSGSGTGYPYLLARRYGKGMIVLGGDDMRLSPARMLENLVRYQEQMKCPENQP